MTRKSWLDEPMAVAIHKVLESNSSRCCDSGEDRLVLTEALFKLVSAEFDKQAPVIEAALAWYDEDTEDGEDSIATFNLIEVIDEFRGE